MGNGVKIRPWRPEDCRILYAWRIDPANSRWNFSDKMLSFEEHQNWFAAFLQDSKRFGYILEDDGEPVAQIRFDIAEMPFCRRVSLGVAPQVHGRGYGTTILRQALDRPELSADTILLVAETLNDNLASQKLFARSGFVSAGTAIRQGRGCQCWVMAVARTHGPLPLRLFSDNSNAEIEKVLSVTGLGLPVEKECSLCIYLDTSANYEFEDAAVFRLRPEVNGWLLDLILNFDYSFDLPLKFDNDMVAVAQIVAANLSIM